MKISGVYKITNTENGNFYIGSSVDISTRWSRHRLELNKNCHRNKYLQNAWNKYGESVFEFSVLEKCGRYNLLIVEQKHLDAITENSYNMATSATAPMLGRKMPRAAIDKLIERNRGRKLGEETKTKISCALYGRFRGEDSPNYARDFSSETRAKMSKAWEDRTVSAETKKKLSTINKGSNNSRALPVVQFALSGERIKTFPYIKKAGEEVGISYTGIVQACAGERRTAGGYQWRHLRDVGGFGNLPPAPTPGNTPKRIIQTEKTGVLVAEFSSINDAARETGISRMDISATCRGVQKTAKGFRWEYA